MRGKTIARPFAEALFELAEAAGELESYGAALGSVARMLDEEPEILQFLETPRVDAKQKKDALRKALRGRVPEPVMNFVLLVVDRRRQRFLRAMAREYQGLLDERMGRSHVEVSVARELSDDEVEDLGRRLSRILGKDTVLHVQVRPELMGGIVFKAEDMIYDGSLRRRLERMKQRLLAADVSTD